METKPSSRKLFVWKKSNLATFFLWIFAKNAKLFVWKKQKSLRWSALVCVQKILLRWSA